MLKKSLLCLLFLTSCNTTSPHEEGTEKSVILSDEGVVMEVYKDSRGFLTGGVGRLLEGKDYELGDPIPEHLVVEWFEEDYRTAREDADKLLEGKEVPQEFRDILTNMAFNLGRTRLSNFRKMFEHVQEENWEEVAYEMYNSEWYTQVPNRADRLISRVLMLGPTDSEGGDESDDTREERYRRRLNNWKARRRVEREHS